MISSSMALPAHAFGRQQPAVPPLESPAPDGVPVRKPESAADAVPVFSPREALGVAFAGDFTSRALDILSDGSRNAEKRRADFKALIAEVFDVDRIGLMLLGPNAAIADERQMTQYRAVIADYLLPLYANYVLSVCDRPPVVIAANDREIDVLVRTAFHRDEAGVHPVMVDWRLAPAGESFRITDLAIDGVSIGRLKRDEFSAVISTKGFDAFLELLHQQAGQGLPEPLSAPKKP